MLLSMTGFGSCQIKFEKNNENTTETYLITAEIKSLNSKGLDLGVKIPRQLPTEKEMWVRNYIKEHLERGKIFVFLEITTDEQAQTSMEIRKDIVKSYLKEAKKIAQDLSLDTVGLLAWALTMPDATQLANPNTSQSTHENTENPADILWKNCQKALEIALQKCKDFRQTEGTELQKMFELSVKKIQEFLQKIEEQDPQRRLQLRQRLEERLSEITQHEYFDKNRFEQEMIFYLEKLDISEEKIRLAQHIQYFIENLTHKDTNGKKLNFISQEMGREINTLGAKANDAIMQQYVILMKEELEKIKEQVLNIL